MFLSLNTFRAVRYGKEFLGAKDGYFHQLVDIVVEKFGDFFTSLKTNPARVCKTPLWQSH